MTYFTYTASDVATELERLAELCDKEAMGTDGGFPDGISTATSILRNRAAELRGGSTK